MGTHDEKILVTGATGMLGSRLIFDLLSSGYSVRAIYRDKNRINQFIDNIRFYDREATLPENKVEWVKADMEDYFQLSDALDNIGMVYHCAAMVSFQSSERNQMLNVNVKGTSNLINACIEKEVKKLCHVSSIAALGKGLNGDLVDESNSWIPEKRLSGYSISKFHSEMEVWRGVNEGLDAVIVNPSVILGPGDWKNGSSSFFGQIAKGLGFYPVGGTGFVDVRDVSKAMMLLCSDDNWEKAKNQKYLLNAANLLYRDIFTSIAKSIKAKEPSVKISKNMLSLAWKLAWLWGKISNTKPLITRDSVGNSSAVQRYDGSKITREFGLTYTPIEETIHYIGNIFLTFNHPY